MKHESGASSSAAGAKVPAPKIRYDVWCEIGGVKQPVRIAHGGIKALAVADTLIGEKLADVLVALPADRRDLIGALVPDILHQARKSFAPARCPIYFMLNDLTVYIAEAKPLAAVNAKS